MNDHIPRFKCISFSNSFVARHVGTHLVNDPGKQRPHNVYRLDFGGLTLCYEPIKNFRAAIQVKRQGTGWITELIPPSGVTLKQRSFTVNALVTNDTHLDLVPDTEG